VDKDCHQACPLSGDAAADDDVVLLVTMMMTSSLSLSRQLQPPRSNRPLTRLQEHTDFLAKESK
jgi:hypothetical protein